MNTRGKMRREYKMMMIILTDMILLCGILIYNLFPRANSLPQPSPALSLSPPPSFLTTSTWKPQGLISPTFSSPGAPKS